MIEQMHPLPAYELDSVNDDRLEALILKLGLKTHEKNSYDPFCVICRQNLMLKNHAPSGPAQTLRHQYIQQQPNGGAVINNFGMYGGPNR